VTERELLAAVESIVDYLFVNGVGEEAGRLVLTSEDGRDLGGWCRGAVRDAILDGLRAGHDAAKRRRSVA
jgi:hypothetical protein